MSKEFFREISRSQLGYRWSIVDEDDHSFKMINTASTNVYGYGTIRKYTFHPELSKKMVEYIKEPLTVFRYEKKNTRYPTTEFHLLTRSNHRFVFCKMDETKYEIRYGSASIEKIERNLIKDYARSRRIFILIRFFLHSPNYHQ